MKIFATRLLPGQDLKTELINFTRFHNIQAGFVLSGVGSVTRAVLRMADEKVVKTFEKKFEIVSITGTLCQDDIHIHVSLSDEGGNVIGGHLKEGCIIYVTAEIVIGEAEELRFIREKDEKTGFNELVIQNKNP